MSDREDGKLQMQYHASADEVARSRPKVVAGETGKQDATMLMEILRDVLPPISPACLDALEPILMKNSISLSVLGALGHEELRSSPFNIDDAIDRARIIAGVDPSKAPCAPPPNDLLGGPVVVRPKFGFTNIAEVDTLNQTVHVRFFVDHHWIDPRFIGASYVPEGTWRPTECYIANQRDQMELMAHVDRPTIADLKDGVSQNGLLLWPTEYVGTLTNPMSLRAFPFDNDTIEIVLHQSEAASSSEYVFREYEEPLDDAASVRIFFSVFENLTEWQLRGFNKSAYESVGGIPTPFSKLVLSLHLKRRWGFYFSKVVFPLITCTLFCFFSFFFAIDETEARLTVSTTMFLATTALLYVIGTEVPKTSYLTVIDKLVVAVLSIQFFIAGYCSVCAGLIGAGVALETDGEYAHLGKPLVGALNLVPLISCGCMLAICCAVFFGWPAYKASQDKPHRWPATLHRAGATVSELLGPTPDGGKVTVGWEREKLALPPGDNGAGPDGKERRPLRYFLFKKFYGTGGNVFDTSTPGHAPPGLLPDPVTVTAPKDWSKATNVQRFSEMVGGGMEA